MLSVPKFAQAKAHTHTHTAKQTETEKRNRNGQRRQCRAELIRQGKVEKVEKAFLDRRTRFLSAENIRENVLLAHFSSAAVIKWSSPRMNTIKIIY